MRALLILPLVLALSAVAACGGGDDGAPPATARSTVGASTTALAPTAAAVATAPALAASVTGPAATAPAAGGPGTNPATRVMGTVKSADGGHITLTDGSGFDLAAGARLTRTEPATAADLVPGKFVAITAKRQSDNTLLASIVMIFSESFSKLVSSGQRPLAEGNLMTNATIDQVSGSTFTVTFTGGGAKIALAPGAQILKQSDVLPSDIKPGQTVSAAVTNGVAMSVSVS